MHGTGYIVGMGAASVPLSHSPDDWRSGRSAKHGKAYHLVESRGLGSDPAWLLLCSYPSILSKLNLPHLCTLRAVGWAASRKPGMSACRRSAAREGTRRDLGTL